MSKLSTLVAARVPASSSREARTGYVSDSSSVVT